MYDGKDGGGASPIWQSSWINYQWITNKYNMFTEALLRATCDQENAGMDRGHASLHHIIKLHVHVAIAMIHTAVHSVWVSSTGDLSIFFHLF